MNKLSTERRAAVIAALCEGNSIRSTCRMTGTAKGTVLRLLVEIGEACEAFHDARVRGIAASQVQCDEVWSFVACKESTARQMPMRGGAGDAWTWVALDAHSKLAISFLVGNRTQMEATDFLVDLKSRLANRVQLSTDGFRAYIPAIRRVFGSLGVDYAQVSKNYATPAEGPARYSPPVVTSVEKVLVFGEPVKSEVSTSLVERQNLTLRMSSRRFTRLTNAFSKSIYNHIAAVALNFVSYNWCKAHGTLTKANGGIKTSPAMAAGLTDHVWTVSELLTVFENEKSN